MNPSARRKLILGGAIAVLGAWVALPPVLRRVGPAQAQAADRKLERDTEDVADDTSDLVASVLAAVAALPAVEVPVSSGWPASPFGCRDAAADTGTSSPAPRNPSPVLRLDGIILGDAPRALIGGQIVGVGDQVAGDYTVTAIDTNSVTLVGPQGPWTLTLPQ
jgi:hypothetical protein